MTTPEEVSGINEQNKANAKGLFKGLISGQVSPTIPNIGRMISSAYDGWVEPIINPKTSYTTGSPTILPGRFPNIEKLFGIKEGTRVILGEAPKIIKKFNLKTFVGSNGQQYVKTPDGKVKSLINFVGELYEKNLATPASTRIESYNNFIKGKQATEVKNRFGTIGKLNHSLTDPAVELKATRGSINKVKGKYSNRNAQTANDLE